MTGYRLKATLAIALMAFMSFTIHGQAIPKPGEPAADFVLPNIQDGKQLRLSDYRGKKVLLIHFASW